MINENVNPNQRRRFDAHHPNNKIANLLVVVITFQEKIEILKNKLCGHASFSPALYYHLLDRTQKSYIELEDMITYIKKAKPNFNIDSRYLKALFKKLNNDDRIPSHQLTYFGYLNMIKPHFNRNAANQLLNRDTVVLDIQLNEAVKKTFDELICTTYACVAEHEKIKQFIILGNMQEGGYDQGELYNIYEIMEIIMPEKKQQSIYTVLFEFIHNNSEYQVKIEDLKYVTAYLMCHEYQINSQKSLNLLFMPVALNYPAKGRKVRDLRCGAGQTYDKPFHTTHYQKNKTISSNFLEYVHPNSAPKNYSPRIPPPQHQKVQRELQPQDPEIYVRSPVVSEKREFVGHLTNPEHLKTPFLQKFLRQSRVLKNMSRYEQVYNSSIKADQSAFIQYSRDHLAPVARQHLQKPVNKDFSLEKMLNNPNNLHKSRFQDQILPTSRIEKNSYSDETILNQFLLK